MKLTASRRIYASFSVLLIIIAIFGIFATTLLNKIEKENHTIVDLGELFDMMRVVESSTINLNLTAMDSIIDKEHGLPDETKNKINHHSEVLTANLTNMKDLMSEMSSEDMLTDFTVLQDLAKKISGLYTQKSTEMIKLITGELFSGLQEKKDDAFFARMDDEIDSVKSSFNVELDKDLAEIEVIYQELIQGQNHLIENAKIAIIVGVLLSIVLGLVLSVSLTSRLISLLTTITTKLVSASSFTTMSSKEISTSSDSLSSTASEQASAIEETTASLEEISGTIKNNLSETERTSQMAESMRDQSSQATTEMQTLDRAMTDILASNEEIKKLVQIIANIGDKTKVMDEIVFQTKLLSFNASVEAERAGEHGRGFAVVAQEVGSLAQMSGKAAQEISEILKASITNADQITKANQEKVVSSNEIVKNSVTILDQIGQSANTLASSAKHVFEASREQEKGIEQINNAMTELDKSTQQNAALAEETSAAGRELATQAQSLEQIVKELQVLIYGEENKAENQRVMPTPSKSTTKLGKAQISKPSFSAPSKVQTTIKPKLETSPKMERPAPRAVVETKPAPEDNKKKSGPDEWEVL